MASVFVWIFKGNVLKEAENEGNSLIPWDKSFIRRQQKEIKRKKWRLKSFTLPKLAKKNTGFPWQNAAILFFQKVVGNENCF